MPNHPAHPDRPTRSHSLQWFALSIAGAFFLSFFVYWVFAALLALSLGAVATGFDQARQQRRVAPWLALHATGAFAFVAGSFLQGFGYQPELTFRARIVVGALEVVAMVFGGGYLPLEGIERLSPWRHIAGCWVAFTAGALLLGYGFGRRRDRG